MQFSSHYSTKAKTLLWKLPSITDSMGYHPHKAVQGLAHWLGLQFSWCMSVLLRSKCVALKLSDDSVMVVLLFGISHSIPNNFKTVCFVTILLSQVHPCSYNTHHTFRESTDSPASCWDRGKRNHPMSSRRSLSSHRGCCCRLSSGETETRQESRQLASFLFSFHQHLLSRQSCRLFFFFFILSLSPFSVRLIYKTFELFHSHLYKNMT